MIISAFTKILNNGQSFLFAFAHRIDIDNSYLGYKTIPGNLDSNSMTDHFAMHYTDGDDIVVWHGVRNKVIFGI